MNVGIATLIDCLNEKYIGVANDAAQFVTVEGSVDIVSAVVHGDLHVDNILCGAPNHPWVLIDFERSSADGFILIDCARLEVSMLSCLFERVERSIAVEIIKQLYGGNAFSFGAVVIQNEHIQALLEAVSSTRFVWLCHETLTEIEAKVYMYCLFGEWLKQSEWEVQPGVKQKTTELQELQKVAAGTIRDKFNLEAKEDDKRV